MQINLKIPDKYKNTNLALFWGMVPIARYKINKGYWEIKTQDCSMCGKCCEKAVAPFYQKGGCKYLEYSSGNGMICSLKNMRPVGCSLADGLIPECTVRWEPM